MCDVNFFNMLKVALNTITLTPNMLRCVFSENQISPLKILSTPCIKLWCLLSRHFKREGKISSILYSWTYTERMSLIGVHSAVSIHIFYQIYHKIDMSFDIGGGRCMLHIIKNIYTYLFLQFCHKSRDSEKSLITMILTYCILDAIYEESFRLARWIYFAIEISKTNSEKWKG